MSDLQPISLDDLESLRRDSRVSAREGVSLDEISTSVSSGFEEDIARANQQLKERVAKDVIRFLGFSLVITLFLTLALAAIDAYFIDYNIIEPAERLITERVVMAVIGATVVQVGAASIAIVYSLFGQPKDEATD
jgi:hypothetical protein